MAPLLEISQPATLPAPRAWPGGRALRNGIAFFLLALAMSMALGQISPFPSVPAITSKLHYFRQQQSEFDTIFIGSSRVFHQIIPQHFDDAMKAGGWPSHSFNFGQDSMWPPESLYVLREILRVPTPGLKWVFIEFMNIRPEANPRAEGHTARMVYWHDLLHTKIAVRSILDENYPAQKQLLLLGHQLRYWAERQSHLGVGADLLRETLGPTTTRPSVPDWLPGRGYQPLARDRQNAEERAQHPRRLETRRNTPPLSTSPLLLEELSKIVALVRQAGAEPVFISSPSLMPSENLRDAPAGVPLLAFNQPDRYPELHAAEAFADQGHLTVAASAVYTTLLAQRFLEYLKSKRTESGH